MRKYPLSKDYNFIDQVTKMFYTGSFDSKGQVMAVKCDKREGSFLIKSQYKDWLNFELWRGCICVSCSIRKRELFPDW